MINKDNKNELRKKRSLRVRKNIHGTEARPRLSVYRSLNHIYAQVINDDNGTTIASANTMQKDVVKLIEGKSKKEAGRRPQYGCNLQCGHHDQKSSEQAA